MLMNVSSNLIVGCLMVSFWCLGLEEEGWGKVTQQESSGSHSRVRKPHRQAPLLAGHASVQKPSQFPGIWHPSSSSPKCTTYFPNVHFPPQADGVSGEERIKMKNSKSQALHLPGFFFWLSVFLFRAEAHPGNLPSEPPDTTLPAEYSKGPGG